MTVRGCESSHIPTFPALMLSPLQSLVYGGRVFTSQNCSQAIKVFAIREANTRLPPPSEYGEVLKWRGTYWLANKCWTLKSALEKSWPGEQFASAFRKGAKFFLHWAFIRIRRSVTEMWSWDKGNSGLVMKQRECGKFWKSWQGKRIQNPEGHRISSSDFSEWWWNPGSLE